MAAAVAMAMGLVARRGCGALGRAGPRAWRGGYAAAPATWRGQQARPGPAAPLRPYGNDAALERLLGTCTEGGRGLLGRHPPPLRTSGAEQENLLQQQPDQPDNPKTLKVAIIGAPNAGKSTLTNQLLGRKVLPVSKKVHTTRCNAQGIITKEDTQLIILDTPGLTTPHKAKRHNLEKSMLHDPWKSLEAADLVLVLVDASDRYTRHQLAPQVLRCLSSFPQVPSILILNKVDLLKRKTLLLDMVVQLTQGTVGGKTLRVGSALRPDASAPSKRSVQRRAKAAKAGWPHFEEIFMLAAISREEVELLQKSLLSRAKPGPWEFHSEVLTSQSPQEVCDNIIREKLLEYLPEEVPYTVRQRTEAWEEGPCGELFILQNLLVQKETHMKMLIGPQGRMINQIAEEAGQDLMNAFLCDVHLKLSVQLSKK